MVSAVLCFCFPTFSKTVSLWNLLRSFSSFQGTLLRINNYIIIIRIIIRIKHYNSLVMFYPFSFLFSLLLWIIILKRVFIINELRKIVLIFNGLIGGPDLKHPEATSSHQLNSPDSTAVFYLYIIQTGSFITFTLWDTWTRCLIKTWQNLILKPKIQQRWNLF